MEQVKEEEAKKAKAREKQKDEPVCEQQSAPGETAEVDRL